ncbi:LPXTG cell wall anchor domain-containing protein [Rothia sp. HMSC061E04]|uniref:LPXTG cell wall anchor domain-containing protein n=1 Tax=Rothia sp. HMSC061E04 TaxID=1739431 RepID=UPI001FEE7D1D|nr:LPXTG cell wall anchor domain-containing protein [Rothia sp. HMSC061E04]
MDVVKDSAAPVLQVDSPRLNTKGETVLKVRGTGYTGEATPHGVRVVVSDTNVWVPGRFPQQGMRFVAEVTVPASQIHNGAFETEVKVPANVAATLNTSHKYIAGTMAAGVQGAEYGSFDAQKPLELFAQEAVVSAVPTYAPTVAPLPEATVGVNPTNAPTVAPLPEATIGVNPTDAPTVAPLPEATVGVNPTDAPTVPALPEATVAPEPVADKTPNADKLEDATVAHPKSKPAQSKPAQEAPVTARSAQDTLAKNTPAKDSPKKATLANTGASSVGVIVGIGVVAICAGLGLSVLRSRRRS